MIMTDSFIIVCILIDVVVMLFLRGLRLAAPSMSRFELDRHRGTRDPQLGRLINFIEVLPKLRALQVIFIGIFTSILLLLMNLLVGLGYGIIICLIVLLVIEMLSAKQAVTRVADRFYIKHEQRFMKILQYASPILQLTLRDDSRTATPAFYSKEELEHLIQIDNLVLSENDKRLIGQALLYDKTSVSDIMTSSKVIETVQADATLGPIELDRLHKLRLDKFPVIRTGIEDIVGVLYLHNLPEKSRTAKHIHEVMQPEVFYVRGDWPLDELFAAILQTNSHLFIVVSEANKVVGLVTMTDVLRHMLGRKLEANLPDYEDRESVATD